MTLLSSDKFVVIIPAMTKMKKAVEELRDWAKSFESVSELERLTGVNKRTLYRFRNGRWATLTVLDALSRARELQERDNNGDRAA